MDTKKKHKNRRMLLIVASAIGLIVIVATLLWSGENSGGEYTYSPNGRYTAELLVVERKTLLEGRLKFVRAQVRDRRAQKTIWTMEYRPIRTANLYDYTDRSKSFIHWNPVSNEVTFPLETTGVQVVVPVP